MSRETLAGLLGDRLYLEPSARLEDAIRDSIDRLWADDGAKAERTLAILKRVLRDIFPRDVALTRRERQRRSERSAKAIYIHSHMDEDTFDVERVRKCCVAVPSPDGASIPTCSYNILYRAADPRFCARPIDLGALRHESLSVETK